MSMFHPLQAAFSWELWAWLPDGEEDLVLAGDYCRIPANLQISSVMVFLCLMLDNVSGMLRAMGLCLITRELRFDNAGDDAGHEVHPRAQARWG